jgi:hypothetical protein
VRQRRCKEVFAELSDYLDDEHDDSLCEELENGRLQALKSISIEPGGDPTLPNGTERVTGPSGLCDD